MAAASNMQKTRRVRQQVFSLPQVRAPQVVGAEGAELSQPHGDGSILHQGAVSHAARLMRRDRAGGGNKTTKP